MHKEAGRPWPVLCDDDVTDFMVMEAVAIKVRDEDAKAQEEAEKAAKRKEFKQDFSDLDHLR